MITPATSDRNYFFSWGLLESSQNALGGLAKRCQSGVAGIFGTAAALTAGSIDAGGRVWRNGSLGYVIAGHKLLSGSELTVDRDSAAGKVWDLYQRHKDPLIVEIKKLAKGQLGIARVFLTDKAIEDLVDQTVYALLKGVNDRLADEGQESSIENVLLLVAKPLIEAKEQGDDVTVFFNSLIGGMDGLPLSDTVKALLPFFPLLKRIPMGMLQESAALLKNISKSPSEAADIVNGSQESVRTALEAAYQGDESLQATQDADAIKQFISHILESALVKTDSLAEILPALLSNAPSSLQRPIVETATLILGSSAMNRAAVKNLLTAVLMNLSAKFISANGEAIREHKASGVTVALIQAVCGIAPNLKNLGENLHVSDVLLEQITKKLAKSFGIETLKDVEEIVAPLLSKESAKALNDLSKEHVSKLIDSFSTEIFSILGEGAALRQRTKQLFGADTQENLEGLTPAEFAAKQIGDFTARLLPHLLQDDKKMLADSTIDSINGQFEGLLGQSLLSAEGAIDPRKFLEITFQAAGEHFPKSQASDLIAQVVNNTCLRAFCKIGEEIQKLQEQKGSKEFVLGLVRNLLGTVSEHFKAVKEGRASRKDLFEHFAEKGLLDPALQEDAKHLRDHAAGSKELRDEMQKTRLEKFYQPIFGKLLVELGDITEEIIPVDPLLQGTLLSLVQDTVLPAVFQSIFDTFLDGENLSKLLIKTLRGQENSLREALAKVDDAVDTARASIQGVEVPMTAPSEELQDSLQAVVKELVEAFPNTLTTSLIQLLESDVLKKNLLGQERGMIAPLVTQVIEEALIDRETGKPKLVELLNTALSLTDLREMDPDPVIQKTPEDAAEDAAEDAVLDAMKPDKLKKTLRKEVRKIVQTGLDVTWKIIADEFQKVGKKVADWLSENVHPIAATLFKRFWTLLSGALFLSVLPFWMIGKAIIWIVSWAEAHAVMKHVDMPIHENMVLKAVRELMEDLREKIVENRSEEDEQDNLFGFGSSDDPLSSL